MDKPPELSLGTVQLGLPYGIANSTGHPDIPAAFAVLDAAWEDGIRTWDTAPGYGESETVLGQFIRERQVQPTLATKLPSVRASVGVQGESADVRAFIDKAIFSSLDRLGVDHVAYYLIHDEEDLALYRESLTDRLRYWKDQGALGEFGLSAYTPGRACEAIDAGAGVLQVPYNLFDSRFTRAVVEAREASADVFARSVFLQGLFFLDGEEAERSLGVGTLIERLHTLAKESGYRMEELALAFVRDVSEATHVLVGAERASQVRENAAAYRAPELPASLIREVKGVGVGLPEDVLNPAKWATRRDQLAIE